MKTDKIEFSDWTQTFGNIEHSVIQSSPRFTEMVLTAEEKGLASAKCRIMKLPGMSVMMANIKPERNLLLCTCQENESVQSAFILDGFAESEFSNRPVASHGNSHAFQYSPYVDERHTITKNLEALHIDFEVDFLKGLIQSSDSPGLEILCNNIEKKEPFLIPPSSLPLQVRMNEIIVAIRDCPFSSVTRSIFIEAKLLELFALQIEQIQRIRGGSEKNEPCSKADKEKLYAVKTYIEQNYLQPLSLRQLCTMFGLNDFKLKKGFKALFGSTVFGHINNLRMQKAMALLIQKNMTVTAIADLVGYSTSMSFSSEFKRKFGYAPSKVGGINQKVKAS